MIIDPLFCGMPELGQGGYVAGRIASALGTHSAGIRLRRPIPVGYYLDLVHTIDGRVELRDGPEVLAEGAEGDFSLEVPDPICIDEAADCATRYPGLHGHRFAACFCCGPDAHDGLRIFPGPVAGRNAVASPWVPTHSDGYGSVPAEFVWAALDCPQLWALIQDQPAESDERVVTGALAASILRPLQAGAPYVVMAWPISREGRKIVAGAAIYGQHGEVYAMGRQTAIVAEWGVPLGMNRWGAAQLVG